MRLKRSFLSVFLTLLFVSAGCASSRGVSVGSDTGNYGLDVTNTTARSVNVYWSTGNEPKMLGTVSAGRKEHFVVAGASSASIAITATDSSGRSLGPYPVVLQAGATKSVTIR